MFHDRLLRTVMVKIAKKNQPIKKTQKKGE